MELDENSYILGYWHASDKDFNDFYMSVKKQKGGDWELQYTFRENKSDDYDDVFSGKDKKNVYNFTADGNTTEEKLLKEITNVFEAIKLRYTNSNDYFLVQGNSDKFLEIAKTKDYLHLKEVTK